MSRVDMLIAVSGVLLGSILAWGVGVPASLIVNVFALAGGISVVTVAIAVMVDRHREAER